MSVIENYAWCRERLEKLASPALGSSVVDVVRAAVETEERRRAARPALASEVVRKYERHLERALAGEVISYSQRSAALGEARRFAGAFGSREIARIEPWELQQWYSSRTTAGRLSMSHYRSELRKLFRFARESMGALPLAEDETAADRVKIETGRPQPRRWPIQVYRYEEIRQILGRLYAHREHRRWCPTVALWAFAGIHFAELMRLRYSSITSAGEVLIPKSVSWRHKERCVLLSPAAHTWIMPFARLARRQKAQEAPIISAGGATPVEADYRRLRESFHAALIEVLRDAGIPFRPNAFRHAFASHLFAITYHMDFVSDQMGSASPTLYKHYLGLVTPEEGLAYFRTSRPGAGDYSQSKPADWLPSWAQKARADVAEDMARAVARKPSWRPRS